MVFLFLDFQAVESITSPSDCLSFEASEFTSIIIWTGATFDAIWSLTCLLLFYLRFKKITSIMRKQASMSRLEIAKMEKELRSNPDSDTENTGTGTENIATDTNTNTNTSPNATLATKTRSESPPTPIPETEHENEAQIALKAIPTNTNTNMDSDNDTDIEVEIVTKTDPDSPSDDDQTDYDHVQTRIKYHKDRQNGHQKRESQNVFTSLQLNFNKFKNKISGNKKRRKKKPDIVHKFLPIMLKLSILSAWCALSTVVLGFGLWTIYPTLSSVIDSTINGICVYLSFGFTKQLYEILCLPFISCKNCADCRTVVKEANEMEKHSSFDDEQSVLG